MLIDTNIIMEISRKQERHLECYQLLDAINLRQISEEVYITRFALNAIEAMIGKVDKQFLQKILLMIYNGAIKVKNTKISDEMMALSALQDLNLDFDDAVQFVTANKLNTYLVTLDKDFKKTGIEVKTPKEVLRKIFPDYS